jgi:hypothetical protein
LVKTLIFLNKYLFPIRMLHLLPYELLSQPGEYISVPALYIPVAEGIVREVEALEDPRGLTDLADKHPYLAKAGVLTTALAFTTTPPSDSRNRLQDMLFISLAICESSELAKSLGRQEREDVTGLSLDLSYKFKELQET